MYLKIFILTLFLLSGCGSEKPPVSKESDRLQDKQGQQGKDSDKDKENPENANYETAQVDVLVKPEVALVKITLTNKDKLQDPIVWYLNDQVIDVKETEKGEYSFERVVDTKYTLKIESGSGVEKKVMDSITLPIFVKIDTDIPGTNPTIATEDIIFKSQKFHTFKVEKSNLDKIKIFWKDTKGTPYNNFSKLIADVPNLVFATNAGMYHDNSDPVGLYIEESKELRPLDKTNMSNDNLNFYLLPNGVFYIDSIGAHVIQTSDFTLAPNIRLATQSGPMLVINGNIHPKFTQGSSNKNIRNGVGVDQQGNVYFVISETAVNFYDFADLFKIQLHCPNALYLDGAVSQTYFSKDPRFPVTSHSTFGAMLGFVEDLVL